MKIRHERPMSELAFQVRAPLGLELTTGEVLTIQNWSLDGFEFPGHCHVHPKEATLSIPFQGVDIRFPVTLEQGDRDGFLSFKNLTGRQRETLAVFYRSLLAGKMAATDEIITSLDTPVDLVPMGETQAERAAGQDSATPRTLRAAGVVALYLLLAGLVFWTLGAGIYSRLATVDIQNARIEAALASHVALQDAFVETILVQPGDTVDRGDILVRMSNPDDVSALDDVRARINLLADRLKKARGQENALQDRLSAARVKLETQLTQAPVEQVPGIIAQLDAFDGQYLKRYKDLFDAHRAVVALIDALEDDIRLLKRERGRLKDAANARHIVATAPGIVTELPIFERQFLVKGTPALTIEVHSPRTARGWVDPTLATALFVGMPIKAEINTPLGRRTLSGSILALHAEIDPDFSPEFGMMVTVEFSDLTPAESRAMLAHEMPVKVRATRAWVKDVFARFAIGSTHVEGQT